MKHAVITTEEHIGLQWQRMARAEGHRKRHPASAVANGKRGHNEQMKAEAAERREAVMFYVEKHPGCSGGDVCKALGISKCNFSDYMRRLRKEGRAEMRKERGCEYKYYPVSGAGA